uniref:Sugar transporter SWEET1 n=1 Tax=Rhabditophanes sp. KR3021 TaxID=114890 RepID=A0AC35U7J6_9BILA
MFEVFQEFNLLNVLSLLAFLTTVALFFCGTAICRQIWRRQDTAEISGAPFLMGVLGGTCWLAYGYLKPDNTVLCVTSVQCVMYVFYSLFYWFMTKDKLWITFQIGAIYSICGSLIAAVYFFGHKVYHPLGIVCVTLNAMDFGAPLAGIHVVLRKRATATLPLPLCIANFLVSTEWFLYGLLKEDLYIIVPNGIGSFLSTLQIIVFLVLPRKHGRQIPIIAAFKWLTCQKDSGKVEDIETIPTVYDDIEKHKHHHHHHHHEQDKHDEQSIKCEDGIPKSRFSSIKKSLPSLIRKPSVMIGDIGAKIAKYQHRDPFDYKATDFSDSDSVSSDEDAKNRFTKSLFTTGQSSALDRATSHKFGPERRRGNRRMSLPNICEA